MELFAEISTQSGRTWSPITRITTEGLWAGEKKLVKEAYSWMISGFSEPHLVRLIQFPLNLYKVNGELLLDLIQVFQLELPNEFWEDRLAQDYNKTIIRSRPERVSAQEQYWNLFQIKRVLDSPLFNRNYSDLESRLPLDWITCGDRVDLIMLIPINLINKYEDLKFRLNREGKVKVLAWLGEVDPRI